MYLKQTTNFRRLLGGVLALALANLANAREIDSVTIRLDNDFVGGTDSRYTAGTEFDFAYQPWSKPDDRSVYHSTLALGQWIFTPEDVGRSDVVEDDRPYAGWSYLRYGRHRATGNSRRSWQLTLGLVGPSSFAEDIQRSVHQLIGDHVPEGWDNQLSDEFGYALEHSRQDILWRRSFANERGLELSEYTRFSLGNIDSSASQGFQLRFGKNLVGSPSRDRIGSPTGFLDSKARFANVPADAHPSRFYWLAGAKASYVAQNLFLDGNRNGRSHSVDRNPWVQEVEAGFAYSRPGIKMSFVLVYRTEEFREQVGGQTFGSFAFTFKR